MRNDNGGGDFRGPKAEWEDDQSFEREGIVVQVRKLPLRWPRYSIAVGAIGKEGQPLRFITVETTGKEEVRVNSKADVIADLVAEAEEYVRTQKQAIEDLHAASGGGRDFPPSGGGYRDFNRSDPAMMGGSGGRGKKGKKRRRDRDDFDRRY